MIKSYKDLFVWQKSIHLVENIYQCTKQFPQEERYGLVSQMRRSAVSIPSNIAEGKSRGTRKDYRHFVVTAYGSSAELETQLEIAKRLWPTLKENINAIEALLDEIMRMLRRLIDELGYDQDVKPQTSNREPLT